MKSTNKDMAACQFFRGVAKVYKYGVGVWETSWEKVDEKIKAKIDRKTTKLANKIRNSAHVVKPSIKTKAVFGVMRLMQKKGWNKADVDYWKAKGWVEKVRPWKKETAPG